jgi:hypothetical protein
VHEAPVYEPGQNKIIFSIFAYGFTSQLQINLNHYPLILSNYTPNPPVSGINGGRYYKGLIYWAVRGDKLFSSGTQEEPGIVALNPVANKLTNRLEQLFWYLLQLSQ